MSNRTYGRLTLERGFWIIDAEPQVTQRLKRLFPRIKDTSGTGAEKNIVRLRNSPEICRELEWFMVRYPLVVYHPDSLKTGADAHREMQDRLGHILSPDYKPTSVAMTRPLRDYQAVAVNLFHQMQGGLLIGDDVGLGKTPTAIGACCIPEARPALIVCPTNLVHQWAKEQIPKFLPDAKVHIIKQKARYQLPEADFYLITYSKLSAWAPWFMTHKLLKAVVYDEIQELRRQESDKWSAAHLLADVVPFRLGLSATPVYNYGSEMFNVMGVLRPGELGTEDEFKREWCVYKHGHHLVKDPGMFGSYLRDNFMMLARKRREVGRELPPIEDIIVPVEHDPEVLKAIKDDSLALAKKILTGTFVERGVAAREFDWRLRQATGIAKAPFVAELIKMIACKEKVLVFAWHREVYSVLEKLLEEFKPVFWTGEESATQKNAAKEAFMHGDSQILFMSQRSAAGVDGLQDVCSVCVYAELDWSPKVHHQNSGRLDRERTDGTMNNVTAFYPLSDSGSDPVIAEMLGIKSAQADGIMGHCVSEGLTPDENVERVKSLAREYLKRHGETVIETTGEGTPEASSGLPACSEGAEGCTQEPGPEGGNGESQELRDRVHPGDPVRAEEGS